MSAVSRSKQVQAFGSLILKLKRRVQFSEFAGFVEQELFSAVGKRFKLLQPGVECILWKITAQNTFIRLIFPQNLIRELAEFSELMYKYRIKSKHSLVVVIRLKGIKSNQKNVNLAGIKYEKCIQTEENLEIKPPIIIPDKINAENAKLHSLRERVRKVYFSKDEAQQILELYKNNGDIVTNGWELLVGSEDISIKDKENIVRLLEDFRKDHPDEHSLYGHWLSIKK